MAQKTTIYLPAELKLAIEGEAARRGWSEARVIRETLAAHLTRPRPQAGLIDGEPIAERADELIAGFGER